MILNYSLQKINNITHPDTVVSGNNIIPKEKSKTNHFVPTCCKNILKITYKIIAYKKSEFGMYIFCEPV